MKHFLTSLIVFVAVLASVAQDAVVQSGTPALLEAPNGKKIRVFLQKLDGDNLTFQAVKSPNDMAVPASKVKSLEFFPKYDAKAVETAITEGNLEKAMSILEPLMGEYAEYMPIANNMRDVFVTLYDVYLQSGSFEKLRKYADTLMAIGERKLADKARVGLALAKINDMNLDQVDPIAAELGSEAAKLYVKATIQRVEGDPNAALKTVSVIIADHGNDMEWLPSSELLAAYCYLDMTGTNSVITTNSAMFTARQVKNMYKGTPVAAKARDLWASLGGEEVEAARAEEKARIAAELQAAKEKKDAELKALREAEEKARLEARAAEKQAAASNAQ